MTKRSEHEQRQYQTSLAAYERPDLTRACIAVATSVPPLVVMWWLMYMSLRISYLLTLLLALPAAGFAVRTFIVQHDCGHGTFFRSRLARNAVGRVCSVFTLLPYGYFRHFHGVHHATSGKLDDRGMDIETLTVREFQGLPNREQWRYRIFRHPLVLFGVAPFLYFVVAMRWPGWAPATWRRARLSISLTNMVLAVLVWGLITLVGWRAFLLVQVPITIMASGVGMWLFYVQHQFEDTYWASHDQWDYANAALKGSSYYALPPLLEWFTGGIGYHHVHHLSPRVPSYAVARCHRESGLFADVPRITLREGFRCAKLALWDEGQQRLVPFPPR